MAKIGVNTAICKKRINKISSSFKARYQKKGHPLKPKFIAIGIIKLIQTNYFVLDLTYKLKFLRSSPSRRANDPFQSFLIFCK